MYGLWGKEIVAHSHHIVGSRCIFYHGRKILQNYLAWQVREFLFDLDTLLSSSTTNIDEDGFLRRPGLALRLHVIEGKTILDTRSLRKHEESKIGDVERPLVKPSEERLLGVPCYIEWCA